MYGVPIRPSSVERLERERLDRTAVGTSSAVPVGKGVGYIMLLSVKYNPSGILW
jgi:hypothetical protein